MDRTPPKKRNSSLTSKEDRISKLPEALLHHILSFLTTEEVVKTCVLSKSWRYVWTSLPFLDFDVKSFFEKKRTDFRRSFGDKMVSFNKLINQVLLRHACSHIVKFRLETWESDLEPSLVESWINYAAKHHVQDLHIGLCSDRRRVSVVLPACFFSCQSLTSLTLLSYGNIDLPKSLGFLSLKTLHLAGFANIDGDIFSSCPKLETLILQKIFLVNLNIHALNLKILKFLSSVVGGKVMIFAPKLTNFKFYGGHPFPCHADNLTSLDEVTIDLDLHLNARVLSVGYDKMLHLGLIGMLNGLRNAKSITLAWEAIEVLSVVPAALNEHQGAFSNLKCLTLKTNKPSKGFNIPACILTYFLNSSTSLKVCPCSSRGTY